MKQDNQTVMCPECENEPMYQIMYMRGENNFDIQDTKYCRNHGLYVEGEGFWYQLTERRNGK